MPTPLTIPSPGESISEVRLGTWHKNDGDWVEKDDVLVEIESDKATLELRAPAAGRLGVKAETGSDLPVGAVVGEIDSSAAPPAAAGASDGDATAKGAGGGAGTAKAKGGTKKSDAGAGTGAGTGATAGESAGSAAGQSEPKATSIARKIAAERGVDLSAVQGTGPSGRITREDVEDAATRAGGAEEAGATSAASPSSGASASAAKSTPTSTSTSTSFGHAHGASRTIRRERMTKLRVRIAERLVEAQHNAAMLTTFNEADMTEVMRLRAEHKESFEKLHGTGLGFMSFFVAACASALRAFPKANASIVGDEVEYHDYADIAVAVGTDKGLVVPVLRNAESLSFAGIEKGIKELAVKARDGKLSVEEMTGGTFTISNGGVYGSLMSTPILNPPQSAILGMHAIKKRPVEDPAHPGQIVLRPMMYLALSYDHRILDGAEAVGFLVHVRNGIEKPERMLLGI